MWARSFSHKDYGSLCLRGRRYTVVSARSLVSLLRAPTADAPKAVERLISQIANDQIDWHGVFRRHSDEFIWMNGPDLRPGTPPYALVYSLNTPTGQQWLSNSALAAFLPALEDRSKFVAAHVLLTHHYHADNAAWEQWKATFFWSRQPLKGSGTYDELRAELSISAIPDAPAGTDSAYDRDVIYNAVIDPRQLPAIRALWHERLDDRIAVMSYWKLAAPTLTLPILWIASLVATCTRADRRRRRQLCTECGYDLRATPERCPECGAIPEKAKA
jgi:hypothetical protein